MKKFGSLRPVSFTVVLAGCLFIAAGCDVINNPYQEKDAKANIFYYTFSGRPKHLDPARSYSSDEARIIGQIYEPPLQYAYLKRPFELEPLTVEEIPKPQYYDQEGNLLSKSAPAGQVKRAVYTFHLKKGILYQNHPCFAKNKEGKYLYHNLTEKDVREIGNPEDFEHTGTRELAAHDYVYQIKRLASPQVNCPIASLLKSYILGFDEYGEKLWEKLEQIRRDRREKGGAAYNQELDEQQNPIYLDLDEIPFQGAKVIDRYTYQVILKRKYPQLVYWMAMPFFAPMPKEAAIFYRQQALMEKNIVLDWWPVGTGPYKLLVNDSSREMILVKNENYHDDYYPIQGEKEDWKEGLLDDAGKRIPFIDRAVYKLEKEAIPEWNKFLQGYYDVAGIVSDVFNQAVSFGPEGITVSKELERKNIRLVTSQTSSIWYWGFNMNDEIVGGLSEKRRKLRQAISIAFNVEEFIEIFLNGRGIAAHGPIPLGIFGHAAPREMLNTFVYDWDKENEKPTRKPIEEARTLLAEAGYPDGKDQETGEPLVIFYDTVGAGAGVKQVLDWTKKQFKALGIELVIRHSDYNRFREKMINGDFQFFSWGWNADYPDPENFLFLLYGPNSKTFTQGAGENNTNYRSLEFDELFAKMENMESTPERLKLIRRMTQILQRDASWIWGYYPVSFGLYHEWYQNTKPNVMSNNNLKYRKIDHTLRAGMRKLWNQPVWWPALVFLALSLSMLIPATIAVLRRERK